MEYFLLFLEGVITFLSPCILPMFPIYISYFAGEDTGYTGKGYRSLLNALGFVLGFTVIFTMIGMMAGTFGAWLQEYQQIVNVISGVVVIVFGLNYTGILKIRLLEKSYRMDVEIETFHFLSAVLFGIVFAIGWTPCVGTFLGSALMIAVQSGSTMKGMVMLLIYSGGLGVPFILCSIFIESLKGTFDLFKRRYGIINKIAGTILIITGVTMMTGTFNKLLSVFTS